MAFTAAVVTVSDTCSAGTAVDLSGPLLQDLLATTLKPTSISYDLIPDDATTIESTLVRLADVQRTDLIITTGGTGFGPRDVTPEATRRVIQREAPQLTLVMSLYSLQKTKFAALSRAICGIRNDTLIVNMPGSKKAVAECYAAIEPVLPHALQHMRNEVALIRNTHAVVQQQQPNGKPVDIDKPPPTRVKPPHRCPHQTGTGADNDRNSPYPMVAVEDALGTVLEALRRLPLAEGGPLRSHLDLPPFRASIKDGYAMRAAGGAGAKRVVAYIAAGDAIGEQPLQLDECCKINTGAAVPASADCVVQVEDTEVLAHGADGLETQVLVKCALEVDLDIRPIGCDLQRGERLFVDDSVYPGMVTYKSILASVGRLTDLEEPLIGIISTGDELMAPGEPLVAGKIYDSNMTMLAELCRQFGYNRVRTVVAPDNREALRAAMAALTAECPITMCTGGVSMGDRDFVKSVMEDLGFAIRFGRVNMKPGKPMTFAANADGRAVFGLPGNPVSAFVTFHLFVLPALRYVSNYEAAKLSLPVVSVELLNDQLELDARPEYARATVTSRAGRLLAEITGDQISSRLQSIDGADVLLHLPARSASHTHLVKGTVLCASVLKHHFITKYE